MMRVCALYILLTEGSIKWLKFPQSGRYYIVMAYNLIYRSRGTLYKKGGLAPLVYNINIMYIHRTFETMPLPCADSNSRFRCVYICIHYTPTGLVITDD